MLKKTIILVVKLLFSGLAISLLFLDLYCDNVNATYLTILFLLVAIIPWITNLKSLEIFNLGKLEWFSKEKQEEIEHVAGNLPQTSLKWHSNESQSENEMMFLKYEGNVPLILAQLRITLESKLLKLCEIYHIEIDKQGVYKMATMLNNRHIIDNNQYNLIRDLLPIMNAAVHGRISTEQGYNNAWVLNIADKLLNSIDFTIKKYLDE